MNGATNHLNGRWAVLNKLILATLPIFMIISVGWGTWVTKSVSESILFRSAGNRFTTLDGEKMKLEIYGRLEGLPTDEWMEDWKDRIRALESQINTNALRLERVITILERVEESQRKDK